MLYDGDYYGVRVVADFDVASGDFFNSFMVLWFSMVCVLMLMALDQGLGQDMAAATTVFGMEIATLSFTGNGAASLNKVSKKEISFKRFVY